MARRPKPWFRKDRNSWFVTINGERHNLGPNKSQAYEQFHQLMRQPAQQKVNSRSFTAIADAFLGWTLRNREEATFKWYRDHLQSFVTANPDISIQELKPYHVEQWASQVPDNSINTRRNKMRAVKRCLKWANAQGYLEANPVAHLDIPTAQGKDVYVSPDDFKRLLGYVLSEPFAELMQVTYEIGCRPQESLRVEARHVDLANSRWVFPKQEAKGKRAPRIIYLSEYAHRVTERLMSQHSSGKLFRNQQGRPWTTDAVNCQFTALQLRMGKQRMAELGVKIDDREICSRMVAIEPYRKAKGVLLEKTEAECREEAKRKLYAVAVKQYAPRYSLYALRHSWATNALQTEGLDSLTVAVLMGHKDPSTLARTYQHLSHNPEHLLKQARKATG